MEKLNYNIGVMSLHANDVCLLEVEDYNLYEEEASDHAFARYE